MSVNVEMSSESRHILNKLAQQTGALSYVEVLNSALALMKWAVEECQDGRRIASVDEAKCSYEPVDLDFLERAAVKVDAPAPVAVAG